MNKPLVVDLRKPFYDLIDGFWGLANTETVKNNSELKSKVETMRQALKAVEIHMTLNYNWD